MMVRIVNKVAPVSAKAGKKTKYRKYRIYAKPYHVEFLGMFPCSYCGLPFPAWNTGQPRARANTKSRQKRRVGFAPIPKRICLRARYR